MLMGSFNINTIRGPFLEFILLISHPITLLFFFCSLILSLRPSEFLHHHIVGAMRFPSLFLAAVFASLLFLCTSALYLPGAVPNEYKDSEKVELKVGKLFSSKTQLPYEYYSLPFCTPSKIIDATDSFGEFLFGDRVANSLYNIRMLREVPNENVLCSMVCSPRVYSKSEMHQFRARIKEEYRVELLLDDLPVSVAKEALIDGKWKSFYELGFPLGFAGDPAVRIPKNKTSIKQHTTSPYLSFLVRALAYIFFCLTLCTGLSRVAERTILREQPFDFPNPLS
jgi:hypothetical protein